MAVSENIHNSVFGSMPVVPISSARSFKMEPDQALLSKVEEPKDSISILKAYNVMKRVIWQSTIHKTPTGEEIDKT